MATKTIAAGRFKQGCFALLKEVAENGVEVIVTKRGRPMARLVPIADPRAQERAILARMRGRLAGCPVGRVADLLEPSSNLTTWKRLPKV